jgi:hypothetical protein
MKPTDGKCEDCKHGRKDKHPSGWVYNCTKLNCEVRNWWTGCVMWEEKEKQTSIHYTTEDQGWW